jgi:Domain of unknown function (DUF4169)
MAEIVNLRRVRKRKDRAAKEAQAAENRSAFGRSKAERALSQSREEIAKRRLDAHERDREGE